MEIVDSLPPPHTKNKQQPLDYGYAAYSAAPGCAWVAGVPSLLILIALGASSSWASHTILAGVWPYLMAMFALIVLPCVVIIYRRFHKLKKLHEYEESKRMSEQRLLQEQVKLTKQTNLLVQESRANGDNVKIQFGDNNTLKSVEVIRAGVLLEQARIAAAEKQTARIVQQEQKRIAGPADRGVRRVSPGAAARTWVGSVEIKSFAQLLAEGVVQDALKQGLLLLGYVAGVLRYGTWLDLYSCAVGGVTGSGKTTTVRFLLFQAILAGAKLLMIDPAIHEPEESLAAQFRMFKRIHLLAPCDDDPDEVAERIRWFWAEYVRRKKNGIKGPAYIFVLDEFNEIIALLPTEVKKELAMLLLRISQSGRKYGLFCMLIGQRWSEQDLGGKPYGSQIRTSLAAMLAHRFTDESQAQKLASSRYAADCLELDQGHFFFRDTHGNMSYTVTPDTVASDGRTIQRLLDEIEAVGGESPFPVNVGGSVDEIEENVVDSVAAEELPLRPGEKQGQGMLVVRNGGLEMPQNAQKSEVVHTDDCAQEDGVDQAVEQAQAAQSGAMKYRLTEEQEKQFCFIYPDIEPNKDECLRKVGANTAYRAHANELILKYNLMSKKQRSS